MSSKTCSLFWGASGQPVCGARGPDTGSKAPPQESQADKLHLKKPEWQSCPSVLFSEFCQSASVLWRVCFLLPFPLHPVSSVWSVFDNNPHLLCLNSEAQLVVISSSVHGLFTPASDLQSLLDFLCIWCCFRRSLAFWLLVMLTVDLSTCRLSAHPPASLFFFLNPGSPAVHSPRSLFYAVLDC